MRADFTIDIDATPQQVFAALTRPEYMTRWMAGVKTVDAGPSGEIGPGSRFNLRVKEVGFAFDFECTVLEFEAPARFRYRLEEKRVDYEMTYTIVPRPGGGCHIEATHELTAARAGRLLRKVIHTFTAATVKRQGADLRAFAESMD